MSLKYRILIMFVIAFCSRSLAQRCSRSYVDGKWISAGDCGGAVTISDIMGDLKRRSEEEKKKWTVFQRRKYGNVDFYRGWNDYRNGFGNRDGDFWLGLEEMHAMTKDGDMEMEINMITRDGSHMVAKYSSFSIGPGSDNYRLHVSEYSGNATRGDVPILFQYSNFQFSTKDADHDSWPDGNCASYFGGAWWFRWCASNNLNGDLNHLGVAGVWWYGGTNDVWWWYGGTNDVFLRFAEMKFRRN